MCYICDCTQLIFIHRQQEDGEAIGVVILMDGRKAREDGVVLTMEDGATVLVKAMVKEVRGSC